jgi:hypothetical protein
VLWWCTALILAGSVLTLLFAMLMVVVLETAR